MIDCKVKNSKKKSILNLEGELTIINASELKNILLDAIDKSKDIELNLDKVTNVDLSCLQLFCSAHRTSLKLDIHLSINSNHPDVFNNAVRDAAFPLNKGCKLDCNNSCLWIEETS